MPEPTPPPLPESDPATTSKPRPSEDPEALVSRVAEARRRLSAEIRKAVVGQAEPIELMLLSLLCDGHALLVGVPGVGKTLMASTLARVLDLDFQRIQFTPDLMPADITGTEIIEENQESHRQERRFLRGPIFAHFILADEINRTPPKTQAALLQAMQERSVSVGRETYDLERPFIVVATQNPIEHEGTYPLPEAQLDRFLFCINVGYPATDEELDIVKGTTGSDEGTPEQVLTRDEVRALQRAVRGVPVSDDVVAYAVRIAAATRPGGPSLPETVARYVACGASPRASQTMVLGAKARALLEGRLHVDFADIRALAPHVLRHRLLLNFKARADGVDADAVTRAVLEAVPEDR